MIGHFGYHLDIGTGSGKDKLVHPFHVGTGQVDKRLDGCEFVFAFFKRYDDAQGTGLLFEFEFDNKNWRLSRQGANCR
jgi:hypothetical protein